MGASPAKPIPLRAAELALATLVFLCSLAVAVVPLGSLWLLSRLDLTAGEFYISALLGCPLALIGAGWVLLRVNGLYQRATGTDSRTVMEASITLAVVLALAGITLWFLSGEGGTHLGP